MSKSYRKDLTGQHFGRLTVIEFVPTENKEGYWKCRCNCGKEKVVRGADLNSGHTQSCGCLNRESVDASHTKHGLRWSRLYSIWTGMKQRCYNPNVRSYKNYGARGIQVCDEWRDNFQAFYDWAMSNGYDDGFSIDRINNNGDYAPVNCRWTDNKTQARNRHNTIMVKYKGKIMCSSEAAEMSGISNVNINSRYYRGDRGERLFRPVEKK